MRTAFVILCALLAVSLPPAAGAQSPQFVQGEIPDDVPAWFDPELDMFCTTSKRLSAAADDNFIVCEPAIHVEDIPPHVSYEMLLLST